MHYFGRFIPTSHPKKVFHTNEMLSYSKVYKQKRTPFTSGCPSKFNLYCLHNTLLFTILFSVTLRSDAIKSLKTTAEITRRSKAKAIRNLRDIELRFFLQHPQSFSQLNLQCILIRGKTCNLLNPSKHLTTPHVQFGSQNSGLSK